MKVKLKVDVVTSVRLTLQRSQSTAECGGYASLAWPLNMEMRKNEQRMLLSELRCSHD